MVESSDRPRDYRAKLSLIANSARIGSSAQPSDISSPTGNAEAAHVTAAAIFQFVNTSLAMSSMLENPR